MPVNMERQTKALNDELKAPWWVEPNSQAKPWTMNGCPDYRKYDLKISVIDHILSWCECDVPIKKDTGIKKIIQAIEWDGPQLTTPILFNPQMNQLYETEYKADRQIIQDALVMNWNDAVELYLKCSKRPKVSVIRKDKNGCRYETTTKKLMTNRQIYNHHKKMVQRYIKIVNSTCVICNRNEELRFGFCFDCGGWQMLDYKLPVTEEECNKAMYSDDE